MLLVGHGTRDQAGTHEFFQLQKQLAAVLEPVPVQAALLEFQEPSIDDGWELLVQKGVEHIHVAPLLLFAAGHAKQDIPEAIKTCQSRNPDVSYDQCGPLSRHGDIIDLVLQRIEESTLQFNPKPQRMALVMVGRGSYDPCATTDMDLLRHLIEHRTCFDSVVTAFYAMAHPKLPEVLEELAVNDQFDGVLVQPHLLFNGRLYQAIAKQVETAAAEHPNLQWKLGGYLGPDKNVAKAIAKRIAHPRSTLS